MHFIFILFIKILIIIQLLRIMSKETKTVYMPLIDNLRKIMTDRGITQATIADYAGIATSQFSKVMSGNVGLSIPQVANIATSLKMNIIDVFTYPEVYVPSSKQERKLDAVLQISLSDTQKDKVLAAIFDNDIIKMLNE